MRDDSYCEALVRAADQDRALATVFAPAAHRRALYALYAFNIELVRVRDAVKEPLAGEIRLQWWREVVAGDREEEARGQPVASALLDIIRDYELPRDSFDRLIDGRRFDVAKRPVESMEELDAYCRKTSSSLMALAARILDRTVTPRELGFANEAGICVALAGLLREFPVSRYPRGLYVPLNVFAQHRASPAAAAAGEASEEMIATLRWMRGYCARLYERAAPLIAAARPSLVTAWLPVALAPVYLRALERHEREPFRAIDVSSFRRMWTLWRAARTGRPGAL